MRKRAKTAPPTAILAGALILVFGAFGPASAANEWGPRIGVADGPDQILVGLQMNMGSVARQLFVQPDAELGFGSDVTVLSLSVPLHYRFRTSTAVKPYAGGGVTAGLVDLAGDSNFELTVEVIGGLRWNLSRGRRFFTELGIGFGDVHDVTIVGGWMLW